MKRILTLPVIIVVLVALAHSLFPKAHQWSSADYYQDAHNGYQFDSAEKIRQVFN